MATTTTDRQADKPAVEKEPAVVKVSSEDRAKYIPSTIRTPDDAVYAYLHGELKEDELRKALAVFGVTTLYNPKVERIDAAYETKIPEDLFAPPTTPYDDYEYRKEQLEAKDKVKLEAQKAAEGETREQTIERETATLLSTNPVN